MASTNQKVRQGNLVIVKFDGKAIGLVTSVRMTDEYSPEPAVGIGDIHVQEYVPTLARHTISVSAMELRKDQMRQAGIAALDGDDMLQGKVFDIVTYATDDGAELRKYIGCSFASGDVEVRANAIIVTNAQFNALNVTGDGL
jgi:hypothetical protein